MPEWKDLNRDVTAFVIPLYTNNHHSNHCLKCPDEVGLEQTGFLIQKVRCGNRGLA
jgi:hypothetical protein